MDEYRGCVDRGLGWPNCGAKGVQFFTALSDAAKSIWFLSVYQAWAYIRIFAKFKKKKKTLPDTTKPAKVSSEDQPSLVQIGKLWV